MLIDPEKLIPVLKKVRAVREHLQKLCPEPQGPSLRVMNLHWAIQDMYALNIEMLEVSFEGKHLLGKVERYDDGRARILVKSSQTDEEKRFVAVKELCHLMIDEKDDWSVLGVETISGLLLEWKLQSENGVGHTNPTDPLQSEYLAEIAAIELMYPVEYRSADLKKLEANETTVARIALEHNIPAHAVDQALRHHQMIADHWLLV
jgi:Zn-dependent peptidase ImmA (M78 family)